MLLSRKEIVSLLLLLTAIISVLNASVFANILPLHVGHEQVGLQVVCVGTAYICLIYAFSTWLYHSNYSRTRLHMRILVAMLLIMMVFNGVACYLFFMKMSFTKLEQSMKLFLLFSKFSVTSKSVSLAMSVLCILLLIVIMALIIVTIIQSIMRRRKSRENSENIEMQQGKKEASSWDEH
ncbi:uncharacterized protein LOC108023656 isoform X2 [Drosophila biarmipes]|uniref:uncharacterized protein LOC108023656 isoform X2 n=1 Tax=Drosophila biarmipes TaxID=125945 RepID=UPI0021CCB16A|nr:uncharacterized protein LOC108023656 isoform X2 [Drosophila biarmipes]